MACLIHAFFYAKRMPAMGLHDRRGTEKAKGGILQERKADARVSRKKSPCHGRDKNVWNGCFLCVTVLSASACIAVIPENRAKAAAGAGLCGGRKEV